ncbi:hypothetical protein [Undibacterium sp.]|uniref:hypothetical protein n=1 Tax=Undibacterium sp. TaxID=1914977 RepID=UPI0027309803|nr:hypothetical protein [Undibacterium sp.]MDP1978038.1 hypothetical protein [Undibacterium sp.]
MAVTNEARIWAFIAQSGHGKGLLMKAALDKLKPKRIIILDKKDENGKYAELVPSLTELAKQTFKKEFRVRYRLRAMDRKGRREEFEMLCRIASAAGNCVYMVEELGTYTTPSYAPEAWADCCNDGRHDGLHIIAASQFPAQLDKSFMSNCTEMWCGYLGEEPHRVVMAKKMDIPPDQIKALRQFHFLHFHKQNRTVTPVVAKIPR